MVLFLPKPIDKKFKLKELCMERFINSFKRLEKSSNILYALSDSQKHIELDNYKKAINDCQASFDAMVIEVIKKLQIEQQKKSKKE